MEFSMRTYWTFTAINIFIGAVNLSVLFLWIPLPTVINSLEHSHVDALEAAMSLGRLDLVSALLGSLGIGLGVFAFISFGYIRQKAEIIAKETAEKAHTEARLAIAKLEKRHADKELGRSDFNPADVNTSNADEED